jgi:N-acylglucosamine 2-epimerase
MKQEQFLAYKSLYKKNLLEDVLPFWETHSVDWKYGGYFTCLDQSGNVYDTDKFIWLQARQVWTFSLLYNQVDKREDWLKIAENGISFLKKYGRDENGDFYFSLTQDGTPLTHAFNIYSECFAALAFGEYARATGNDESYDIAVKSYNGFLERQANPKGKFEKSTGNRPMKSFGLPMMTAYLTYELQGIINPEKNREIYEDCVNQIFEVHYNSKTKIIHEHVSPIDQFMDTFEGRLINPGHGIEAMWFLMDVAEKLEKPELIKKASDICLQILEYSWDQKHGGIFYFMDSKGAPLPQLEWDQKLWWVHQEALIALSRALLHTQRKDVWAWYEKVHQYTWQHFPDPRNGEWFGYLNRQGIPHTTLKGGKWKGCFHTPRAMHECWKNFEKLTNQNQQ